MTENAFVNRYNSSWIPKTNFSETFDNYIKYLLLSVICNKLLIVFQYLLQYFRQQIANKNLIQL